ncbi:MAG: LptE family protein [Deltaproteobacteria bacterium]|nr:LptE family protein [Deltaproteobacteria bacterium]
MLIKQKSSPIPALISSSPSRPAWAGNWLLLILLTICMWVAIGCGYGFGPGEVKLPPHAKNVFILMFDNKTTEPDIGAFFSDALGFEFSRSGVLKVTDRTRADLIVEGEVVSLKVDTISYGQFNVPLEKRAWMTVKVRLTELGTNKVLWRDDKMSWHYEYLVDVSDPRAGEASLREAIRQIAKNLAQKMHDRMLAGF